VENRIKINQVTREVRNTGEFNWCSFNNPATKSSTHLIKQQREREGENREQAWDQK
jgi:hypothetical protein